MNEKKIHHYLDIAIKENKKKIAIIDYNIEEIPSKLFELKSLEYLNLNNNRIRYIPDAIGNLQNLKELSINYNKLKSIPPEIGLLTNLKKLILNSNQINCIPAEIEYLKNLEYLVLSENQISTIPSQIGRLKNIKIINLIGNNIKNLPPEILMLEKLEDLYLYNNPFEKPPIEIIAKGFDSIKEYLRQVENEGLDYIYEAKLLIVGEPGAGKTTLAQKIINSNYQLRNDEETTEGIDVFHWKFKMENEKKFKVSIWDFGGQEIYHATHQFFLTKRSLYTLVADTRNDDTDFFYWINIIDTLSDSSPLLIVKNEKQDRKREINERRLRGKFSNFKETISTNLSTNRGLKKLNEHIKHNIVKLQHIGTALPNTWIKVREVLEKDNRNYIPINEYKKICENNGFKKLKDILQLSDYLHDLGVCLHFQNNALLKKTVILKPNWATYAVYKVLDNTTVIKNYGKFNLSLLEFLWHEKEYENMHSELLQLMLKFQLCYKIPGTQDDYIAPQLLTENQPVYDWDNSQNLIVKIIYQFMPKGIMTRLIVKLHKYIEQQKYVWKTGAIFDYKRTKAEVTEFYEHKEIKIRIAGTFKRELMTLILWELDRIHETFHNLKCEKLIPCNCDKCKNNQQPHFFNLDVLNKFQVDKQEAIQCFNSYEAVLVRSLIDDVLENSIFNEPRLRQNEKDKSPKIHISHVRELKIMPDEKKQINVSGNMKISNSTINLVEKISGDLNNAIKIIPRTKNPDKNGLRELLENTKKLIENTNEQKLSNENKIDFLKELENLAKIYQKNIDKEEKKSLSKKSIRYLRGLASELPNATKIALESKKLIAAISDFF